MLYAHILRRTEHLICYRTNKCRMVPFDQCKSFKVVLLSGTYVIFVGVASPSSGTWTTTSTRCTPTSGVPTWTWTSRRYCPRTSLCAQSTPRASSTMRWCSRSRTQPKVRVPSAQRFVRLCPICTRTCWSAAVTRLGCSTAPGRRSSGGRLAPGGGRAEA
jgi:hypothetical protein